MSELFVLLDFLSKAVALALTLAALFSVVFHKFVNAAIDAAFKRRVDAELEQLKAELASALEEKRPELSRKLASEVEAIRGQFARELEQEKQQLAEIGRREARIHDTNASYYEIFHFEYGRILVELQAMLQNYRDAADNIQAGLGDKLRSALLLNLMDRLSKAQENISKVEHYVDVINISKRIAMLYSDLINYMTSGANDQTRLKDLMLEYGLISAILRDQLTAGLRSPLVSIPETPPPESGDI